MKNFILRFGKLLGLVALTLTFDSVQAQVLSPDDILPRWHKRLSTHQAGDACTCIVGARENTHKNFNNGTCQDIQKVCVRANPGCEHQDALSPASPDLLGLVEQGVWQVSVTSLFKCEPIKENQ